MEGGRKTEKWKNDIKAEIQRVKMVMKKLTKKRQVEVWQQGGETILKKKDDKDI